VDLADVPIQRGPVSGMRARQLGARAFTEKGTVHVPDEAGPLEAEPGRRLLVHELAHVAQQRRLAQEIPAETSIQGRALEAEALALEAASPAIGLSKQSAGHDLRAFARALAPAATTAPAPISNAAASPGIQRAAQAPDQSDPAAEPSLDEIVARLYERVSSRLRAELLVDRERAGVLHDG
jgi:hypothetical protein